jgi:hypothetical protein
MRARISATTYGPAADRRPGGVLTAVCLRYGDAADPSASVIDIWSDFTPEFKSCSPLEYELGRAWHEYEAMARGEREISDPPDEPEGPFTQGGAEILVEGSRQEVEVLTYRDLH